MSWLLDDKMISDDKVGMKPQQQTLMTLTQGLFSVQYLRILSWIKFFKVLLSETIKVVPFSKLRKNASRWFQFD